MERFVPAVATARGYQRAWLRGDVVAGITVAAYLVPQCMAYGELAGLPAVVGLWAILPALAIYAVLGSSRQLSVGPESTTAVMTATALAPLALDDPTAYAAMAATLALLVGAACLIAFCFRLGFLADLLSKPILVGYLAGVALIMIAGQLGRVTGVPVDGTTFTAQVGSFVANLTELDGPTTTLAAGVLAFLVLAQRFAPRLPGPLLAVLASTLVVALFRLTDDGIAVVGTIPAGLPAPRLPEVSWDDLAGLVGPALGIALVGYSDNVLTGRAFAARRGEVIDANQELLALGAANTGAGLFQGFPVSSSGSRTVLGEAVGGRTQLAGLISLVTVVLVLLFLRPLLSEFPTAALGAIIVYAATRLIDLDGLRRLWGFRRSELVLALATTVGVLAVDILYGVLVAIALSMLDLLRRVARPHDAVLGQVPGLGSLHDIDDYPQAQTVPGLMIYRYDAPLFFANAEDFRQRALAAIEASPEPVEWFVLNVEANVEMDITGADALEALRAELARRGIRLGLARLKQDLRDDLEPTGVLDRIGEDMIFPSLPDVLDAFARRERPPASGES
ncbi:SulP family inorganic anion transporter [Rhabdothermincola sediminis]|uniref:SulP family inorganic anion transporter n=1 Tax=Rhabdothermincola sediminis TaxID=2751370 RepID=UPI001AA0305C|nr:sulfate permease [Rhabdothermincola sediminis]